MLHKHVIRVHVITPMGTLPEDLCVCVCGITGVLGSRAIFLS